MDGLLIVSCYVLVPVVVAGSVVCVLVVPLVFAVAPLPVSLVVTFVLLTLFNWVRPAISC